MPNDSNTNVDVGKNIARIRRTKQMTQMELALMVGISQQTLSIYERQRIIDNNEDLEKIAKALGVTLKTLKEMPEDFFTNCINNHYGSGDIINTQINNNYGNPGDSKEIADAVKIIKEAYEEKINEAKEEIKKLKDQLNKKK